MVSSFFTSAAKPLLKIYLALAIAATLPGCLTIARGTTQEVSVISEPPGAWVTVGRAQVRAPGNLRLRRGVAPLQLEASMEGRETLHAEIIPLDTPIGRQPYLLPVALVSGLLILPGLIDLSSGCCFDWPYSIRVILPEKGAGAPQMILDREPPLRRKPPP